MQAHHHSRAPRWMLVVLALGLVAGHGVILRYVSSRPALPAAALAGLVILLVIQHLGLAGALRRV